MFHQKLKKLKMSRKLENCQKNSTCTPKSNTCLTETNKFCNKSTTILNQSKDIFDISSEYNVNNVSTFSSPRELIDSYFTPKSNQSSTELEKTFSKVRYSKITIRKKKSKDINETLVQGSEELDVTFGNLSLSKVTSRRKDRYVMNDSVIEEVESPCSYNESLSEQIQSPIFSPDSISNSKWLNNQHSSEEESLTASSPDLTQRYSVNSSIKEDVQQLPDEEYYPVFLYDSNHRRCRSLNSARLARKQTDQQQEITLKSIPLIFRGHNSMNSTLSVKEQIDQQLFRQESSPDLTVRCTSENSFLFDQQKDERLSHVSSPNSTLASPNPVQLIKKQAKNTIGKIYRICEQNGPLKFTDVFTEDIIKHTVKIGEGSYGEIFYFKPPDKTHSSYVFKICPIPDSSEEQLQNILTEVKITNALSTLATSYFNRTKTFCKVNAINIIQGKYPKGLVGLWNNYKASTKGTENECPSQYNRDQLYVSIKMKFAGTALEDYVFSTAAQAYYVLIQVIFALAVAETAFEFEHRDLHNGNVLINTTKQQSVCYMINGVIYEIPTEKRKAKIIDFSLSRVNDAYIDLEKDVELFNQSGDLQYDVYRQMRNDVQRNWQLYVPKTNVRWIQYLADKCCLSSSYTKTGKKTVKHSKFLTKIKILNKNVLQFNSAVELAATFKEFKCH